MNYCGIQQNGVASRKEMRSFVSVSVSSGCYASTEGKDTVVCPKPRRVGVRVSSVNDPSRSLRWHLGHHSELSDSRAGSDLLDIILNKGGVHGAERSNIQLASSPPFFCGSPPSRVSNPLIKDARFQEEKQLMTPMSPLPSSPIQAAPLGSASSPNSSLRKSGCVRMNFGNNPAVRVEGFDCLDRDRRNCSIPTLV